MAERALPERDVLPEEQPERYPNNSNAAKEKAERYKNRKVEAVTEHGAKKRKKSLGRKIGEIFGLREGQGILSYIIGDIIVPATQDMLVDSIINGAEMAILGERRGSRRSRYGARPRPYDRVSYREDVRYDRRDRDRDRYRDDRHYDDRRAGGAFEYEDIFFDTQGDADRVLQGMLDLIDEYGQAAVTDFYDLAGCTMTADQYPAGNYGWRNLATARVYRISGGYAIDLPRARLL